MRYYDVTCNINGRTVTFPIGEDEVLKAYGEYIVDIITDKIEKYMTKNHPDAAELFGDRYRSVLRSVGHDILDCLETEDQAVSSVDDACIGDFVRENLFHYYGFSIVLLPNNKANLYGKAVAMGEDHLVASITKTDVVFEDAWDAQYLDVLREIRKTQSLLK